VANGRLRPLLLTWIRQDACGTKNKLAAESLSGENLNQGKPMESQEKKIALAIHGGAGIVAPSRITSALERDLRAGLQRALDAGHAIVDTAGKSVIAIYK
jgi:hypothetical protein